jgi:hypothetical protein
MDDNPKGHICLPTISNKYSFFFCEGETAGQKELIFLQDRWKDKDRVWNPSANLSGSSEYLLRFSLHCWISATGKGTYTQTGPSSPSISPSGNKAWEASKESVSLRVYRGLRSVGGSSEVGVHREDYSKERGVPREPGVAPCSRGSRMSTSSLFAFLLWGLEVDLQREGSWHKAIKALAYDSYHHMPFLLQNKSKCKMGL